MKSLLDLNNTTLSTIMVLFTSHRPLRYRLKKVGKVSTDKCRFCKDCKETVAYVIDNCMVLIQQRYHHLLTYKSILTYILCRLNFYVLAQLSRYLSLKYKCVGIAKEMYLSPLLESFLAQKLDLTRILLINSVLFSGC